MAEKWSGAAFTAADVADLDATASSVMGIGATATGNFKVTLGKLATWLATIGFAAATITAASLLVTGTSQLNGNVGIGIAPVTTSGLLVGSSVTAAAGTARVARLEGTLVAAANNDALRGVHIANSFTPGAFTGLQYSALRVAAFSVAGFMTPGTPVGLDVGIITGTGAATAVALQLAPPTGATANYLIAHTTPSVFSVSDVGTIATSAGKLLLGTTPLTTAAINIDATSYSNNILTAKNGTANGRISMSTSIFGITTDTSGTTLQFGTAGTPRWNVLANSAASDLQAVQVTARIISGATSAALRTNANTNNVWLWTESGTTLQMFCGNATTASATFDQSATAGDTRMLLYTVDTGTVQRVRAVTNAAVTTLLGFAGRVLATPL